MPSKNKKMIKLENCSQIARDPPTLANLRNLNYPLKNNKNVLSPFYKFQSIVNVFKKTVKKFGIGVTINPPYWDEFPNLTVFIF